MEFMLDTVNLKDIETYSKVLPLAGVTSNPSIVKKEGKIEFFQHMKAIRNIIGKECSLHVQVVAKDYEGMMKDAEAILHQIDSDVYIKVPVNEEGLKVIKALKNKGVNVTATAIYTEFQGFLAIAAGADYIAPYYNRMENLNIDSKQVIMALVAEIERTGSQTKVLAASFKNVGQVTTACNCGAQAATMGIDVVEQGFKMPSINIAVEDFTSDWEAIFGENTTIADL